jgi:predicted MPP superfamily phosphohydrolase
MRRSRIYLDLSFLAVALVAIASGHYYIALRLVLDPGIPPPGSYLLAGLVGTGYLLAIAPRLVQRILGLTSPRALALAGSVWMGLFFYLVVILGAADLLMGALLIDRDAWIPERAAAVLFATLLFAGGGAVAALRTPGVRRVAITLKKWPRELDGFKIVQLSDLHLSLVVGRGFAGRITERCNALEPDLVAITGDLVDGSVEELREEVRPLGELKARHGVYFVTGNHEHYSGAKPWARAITKLGIEVLRNRHVRIGYGAAAFYLAGTNDRQSGRYRPGRGEDLDKALEKTDRALPVILLAHDPQTFYRASDAGVDLQLSGHTHGGQLWPFSYLVRLRTRFIAGLYRRRGSQIYVSRGTGFWGPPMRVFAPSEITEITIRGED